MQPPRDPFVRRPQSSGSHPRPDPAGSGGHDVPRAGTGRFPAPSGGYPAASSQSSSSSPEPVAERLGPGDLVGRYRVLEELGRGAQGRVFLVERSGLGRRFALKLLSHGDAAAVARFRREAELASRLDHPGVVSVFDVGQQGGAPYYVMEYCPGRTLAERLREGALEPRHAAELVASLAETLAAAHAAGVLHRDLKPANVLLPAAPSARPRLTDFGLARALEGVQHALTQSGELLGTPYYMAPEQAEDARSAGEPADVYSLGVILFECLTGQRPFTGATSLEVLTRARHQPTPSARDLAPRVPARLSEVCARAMARDLDARLPSAALLAAELAAFLEEEPSAPSRAPLIGVALVLATLLIAGLGAALHSARGGGAPAAVASAAPPTPSPSASPTPELDPQTLLAEARGLAEDEGPALTAARLDALLAADPDHAEALLLRGSARLAAGQPARGRADLGRALTLLGPAGFRRLASDLPLAWQRDLRAAADEGLLLQLPLPAELHLAHAQAWAAEAPPRARAPLERALLLAARGAPLAELDADLRAAASAAPDSLVVRLWQARVLTGRDAYDHAQAAIDAARGLGPTRAQLAELSRLEADLIWRRGNLHDSPPAWREVARVYAGTPDGLCASAQAAFLARHERRAGFAESRERIARALELDPQHSRARALEVLFRYPEDPGVALRLADEALRREGCLDTQLLSFRAFAYATLLGQGPAQVDLRQRHWEAVFGATLGAYHRIGAAGSLLIERRDWVEALLRRTIELEPRRAHAHEYLGNARLVARAPASEVLEHWTRAHELEPRNGLRQALLSAFRQVYGDHPGLAKLSPR
ncbi:MAG TPA: hypothetical protein DEA08_16815 [Planctomycetes bacterium]|nr:hypothetical protein [Planctomycetota bacterium]